MFDWLIGDWRSIGFVALSTTLIYLSVVVAVRLGERRTLAEMTVYDFAVAIALGSIIGRTATTASPSYAQGVTAVVALLASHHFLSVLRTRFALVRRVTDRSPVTLAENGTVDHRSLRRAHMTEADLATVLREHGFERVADTTLVTLEPRGAFSVVRRRKSRARPT